MKRKRIEFPLEMRDGRMVRELDEFREYFDLRRAVGYFASGRLQEWLESSYNDDILEEISMLTGQEEDFVRRFTEALGVEAEAAGISVEAEKEKARIRERLRQLYPEKTAESLVPSAADSQEGMERLLSEGCDRIYLLQGTYHIPADAHGVSFTGIRNPEIFLDAADRMTFAGQRLRFSGVIPGDENTERLLGQGSEPENACTGLLDVLERFLDKMQ